LCACVQWCTARCATWRIMTSINCRKETSLSSTKISKAADTLDADCLLKAVLCHGLRTSSCPLEANFTAVSNKQFWCLRFRCRVILFCDFNDFSGFMLRVNTWNVFCSAVVTLMMILAHSVTFTMRKQVQFYWRRILLRSANYFLWQL